MDETYPELKESVSDAGWYQEIVAMVNGMNNRELAYSVASLGEINRMEVIQKLRQEFQSIAIQDIDHRCLSFLSAVEIIDHAARANQNYDYPDHWISGTEYEYILRESHRDSSIDLVRLRFGMMGAPAPISFIERHSEDSAIRALHLALDAGSAMQIWRYPMK